jgi:hypothetical protein
MTITVDVTPELKAELARQAAARGVGIDAYAASLLQEAVQLPTEAPRPAFDAETARKAAARIRELREGVTLGGLTIRQLIDEGRA